MNKNFIIKFPISSTPCIICYIEGNIERSMFNQYQGQVSISFSLMEIGTTYLDDPCKPYTEKYKGTYDINSLPEDIIYEIKQHFQPGNNYHNMYKYASYQAICWIREYIFHLDIDLIQKEDMIEKIEKCHDSLVLTKIAYHLSLL